MGTLENATESADKITLRLSSDARNALKRIAASRGGVSMAEVIRRAIGTELFLLEEQANGSRILIEDEHGKTKQLVLR